MIDTVELSVKAKEKYTDTKKIRIEFCNLLLEELKKMKGEDLEPCLSEVTVIKDKHCSRVCLEFK